MAGFQADYIYMHGVSFGKVNNDEITSIDFNTAIVLIQAAYARYSD